MKENFETCKHAKEHMQIAVFVQPGCRLAHMIHGILCVTKKECRNCKFCEPKQGAF